MGLTMSQWDDLDEHDRAWALGLDVVDAERDAGRCTQCGGPASECQDTANQHAYEVTWRRCYKTAAVRAAEKKRTDTDGVMAVVTLNPAKKKIRDDRGRFAPTPTPEPKRLRDERGRFIPKT